MTVKTGVQCGIWTMAYARMSKRRIFIGRDIGEDWSARPMASPRHAIINLKFSALSQFDQVFPSKIRLKMDWLLKLRAFLFLPLGICSLFSYTQFFGASFRQVIVQSMHFCVFVMQIFFPPTGVCSLFSYTLFCFSSSAMLSTFPSFLPDYTSTTCAR